MKQYKHGGDIYTATQRLNKTADEILDFSANINPRGIPEGIKEALKNAIEKTIHYPDPHCRELTRNLADYHHVSPTHILCGNGAADLIFRLAYAIKPKKGMLLVPTFSEYEAALKSVDAEILYVPLKAEDAFQPTQAVIDQLTPDIRLLFLCNPNNPTGVVLSKEILIPLLERCKALDIICMVDECFNDFLEEAEEVTLVQELEDYPNLVILKAFTKMYAIPGVRLGYVLCSDEALLDKMYAVGQCWSVSTLAQTAGCAALREIDFVKATVQLITKEREKMREGLERLGYTVYASRANYLFFYGNNRPLDILLYQEGLLIRNCDNYEALEKGYFRIAVKSPDENHYLIQQIERITKQWENH